MARHSALNMVEGWVNDSDPVVRRRHLLQAIIALKSSDWFSLAEELGVTQDMITHFMIDWMPEVVLEGFREVLVACLVHDLQLKLVPAIGDYSVTYEMNTTGDDLVVTIWAPEMSSGV